MDRKNLHLHLVNLKNQLFSFHVQFSGAWRYSFAIVHFVPPEKRNRVNYRPESFFRQ